MCPGHSVGQESWPPGHMTELECEQDRQDGKNGRGQPQGATAHLSDHFSPWLTLQPSGGSLTSLSGQVAWSFLDLLLQKPQ